MADKAAKRAAKAAAAGGAAAGFDYSDLEDQIDSMARAITLALLAGKAGLRIMPLDDGGWYVSLQPAPPEGPQV